MKKLAYVLLLIYVFIIPIYYQHMKESSIGRGLNWNAETKRFCAVVSAFWPFGLTIEVAIALDEGWAATHKY